MEKNWFGIFCASVFVSVFSLLVLWICAAKIHQGYYLGIVDGTQSSQIFPVYRIYNNWKWYPDSTAYETLDKEECLQLFDTLTKNK